MYTLQRTQRIPISLDEAWKYFSSPANLQEITPADMNFEILSNVPEVMYEGMFIHYKVSPAKGLRLHWTTEITHVKEREFFVDEQRAGPYRTWHHEHHFREIPGGVEMTDILNYQLPFGWLGNLVHRLWVSRKVNNIFDERYKAIEHIFGGFKEKAA